MKKIFICISAAILTVSLLCAVSLGILAVYARRNVDYKLDEALFEKAGEEETAYYYAYNKNGDLEEVWKSFGKERREWVQISDVSRYLIDGFIAVEDREFYKHSGINLRRTLAAAVNHIFKFRDSFGASTITQQVVKNISGDSETTVKRKVNEILRAINLEKNHTKNEILEMYLNIAPMSDNIYGVSLAAEIYFGKDPSDLTVSEAATIIGITNAPGKYNPFRNPEGCREKRNRVLYAMLENGAINENEYNLAVKSALNVKNYAGSQGKTSWFVETAINDIITDITQKYDISSSAAKMMLKGAKIILTMSPEIQKIMEDYFSDTSNLSERFYEGMNYAMVVSDPYSGNLLGIVGNGGSKKGERLFNHAIAPVTPGSTLKPLALYAPLLDRGEINWSSMVSDEPVRYIRRDGEEQPYPKNTPNIYDGEITINEAIKKSKNTVAIRLLEKLGIDHTFDFLVNNFEFLNMVKSDVNSNGSAITDLAEAPLALGQLSRGESIRKLTEAYNVFPNRGILKTGSSYYAVYDSGGKILIKSEAKAKQIFKKSTADIMNQLLMNVVSDGTARQITLKDSIDTAGKTGTSSGDRDRLFVGYTPYYSAGIWCGFSNGKEAVGSNSPTHLQIWDAVMKKIHNELVFKEYDENVRGFDVTELSLQPYCSISGETPSEECELDDEARIEYGYFSVDNLPNEFCKIHE